MSFLYKISATAALVLACIGTQAQTQVPQRNDVFLPIGKYIVKGDAECLAAWFDDNLEIAVMNNGRTVSKAQAQRILKAFFDSYTPSSFTITHTAEKSNMKYALGSMTAGGENFTVTIFVRSRGDSYRIQQLKIERL